MPEFSFRIDTNCRHCRSYHLVLALIVYTYMQYIHAPILSYIRIYMQPYLHTCTHTRTHTFIHPYNGTCTHSYKHAHMSTYTYIHVPIQTFILTTIFTYIQPYLHTYNHTHKCAERRSRNEVFLLHTPHPTNRFTYLAVVYVLQDH